MLEDKDIGATSAQSAESSGAADDRRQQQRHIAVFRVGKLITGSGQEFCLIRNISVGGLMANIYSPHKVGELLAIELKTGHVVTGRIVWARENKIGVAFDEQIDVAEILASQAGETGEDFHPRMPRIEIRCPARLRVGARYQRVEICDISQGGAKIAFTEALTVGAAVVLLVDGLSAQPGTVRWAQNGRAGIAFNIAIPFGEIASWTTRHY